MSSTDFEKREYKQQFYIVSDESEKNMISVITSVCSLKREYRWTDLSDILLCRNTQMTGVDQTKLRVNNETITNNLTHLFVY